jgi:hypothetical protein
MCRDSAIVMKQGNILRDGRGLVVTAVMVYPGYGGRAVTKATKDTHGALILCDKGARTLCDVLNEDAKGLECLEVIKA